MILCVQDAELTECAASEETDSREKPEQEDRQRDRQQVGQTVCPPAAESSSTESKVMTATGPSGFIEPKIF